MIIHSGKALGHRGLGLGARADSGRVRPGHRTAFLSFLPVPHMDQLEMVEVKHLTWSPRGTSLRLHCWNCQECRARLKSKLQKPP